MNCKKWAIAVPLATLLLLLLFAAVMFLTDPLLVFRKDGFFLHYNTYNQMYSAPGVARQYTYDTVITGSSMTGEVSVSQVNELLGADAVKFVYNAATAANYKEILDICFASQPDIKNVILSMDATTLTGNYADCAHSLPEYLYHLSWESYPKYLLSLDIFYHHVPFNVLHTLRGETQSARQSACAGEAASYGRDIMLDVYYANYETQPVDDTSAWVSNARENFTYNLKPYFEAHPDTEFYIYLPAFSVLYWDLQQRRGCMEPMLESLRAVLGDCLAYDNVHIYAAQWNPDMIVRLDEYRDTIHFSPKLTAEILHALCTQTDLLSAENYEARLDAFCAYIRQFDYAAFLSAQNP